MKIVIDSSVWIAGIGSKTGYASEVIYKCFTSTEIEIVISEQILAEVSSNLCKKLKFENNLANEAATIIKNLCDYSLTTSPAEEKSIERIKYAPDKHILALAQKSKSDYLVTFDRKHLLPLKKYGKVEIVKPKEFIEKLGSDRNKE